MPTLIAPSLPETITSVAPRHRICCCCSETMTVWILVSRNLPQDRSSNHFSCCLVPALSCAACEAEFTTTPTFLALQNLKAGWLETVVIKLMTRRNFGNGKNSKTHITTSFGQGMLPLSLPRWTGLLFRWTGLRYAFCYFHCS